MGTRQVLLAAFSLEGQGVSKFSTTTYSPIFLRCPSRRPSVVVFYVFVVAVVARASLKSPQEVVPRFLLTTAFSVFHFVPTNWLLLFGRLFIPPYCTKSEISSFLIPNLLFPFALHSTYNVFIAQRQQWFLF